MAALLSSKFLNLSLQWQGMAPETIAARNGHKRVAQIIMVSGSRYLLFIYYHLLIYLHNQLLKLTAWRLAIGFPGGEEVPC